jgi:hypothetical protein
MFQHIVLILYRRSFVLLPMARLAAEVFVIVMLWRIWKKVRHLPG